MQCTYVYIPSPLCRITAQSELGIQAHYVVVQRFASVLFVAVLITMFLLKTVSLLVCTILFFHYTKCQHGMKCVVRNAHSYMIWDYW